jgi:hypothetical protein
VLHFVDKSIVEKRGVKYELWSVRD